MVVASPVRVHSFATGMGILTKNDHVDAHALALYGALRQPEAWVPPQPAIRELKALREDMQREQNRLEKLHGTRFSTRVEASVTKMIAALDAELLSVQQQIGDHIDNYPDLKQDMKYMTSVKGIGKQVGSNTLAVPRRNAFSSPKQAVAWLDLVPREKRSGSSVNGRSRLTQTGPADLRAKLYLSGMTAIKHNSMLRIFYERLLKAVKAKMSALCAVMRKLTRLQVCIECMLWKRNNVL
ncbi:IS110 family transposase [Pantoea agglomerans]|nr:IS110 family transposase [Pantoea agglomerans]